MNLFIKYFRILTLFSSLVAPTSLFAATGSLTPATWDYGSVTIGSSSTKIFTLTAAGAGSLTVTSATVSAAPFTKTLDGCTGISMTAGGTCTVTVQYSPTATSVSNGTLTLVTNATDGTTKISAFVGTGVTGPTVTGDIDPTEFDFGSVTLGSSSSNTFTITNTGGTVNLTITSATASAAPFIKTSDGCTGVSLALGESCDIQISYFPTAITTSFGTLTVVTNATDGTNKVASLTGTGITGSSVTASLSPSSFDFGGVTIGSASTTSFTIENTGGTVNLTITSATVSAAPFVKTADTCTGASLVLGGTCTIDVTYFPTATSTSFATLTVVTNATDGTSKIASLFGTGITGPSVTGNISPLSHDYGNVTIGSLSSSTFTIENTGGTVNLNITSATVSAAPFIKTSDGCTGASLGFGETCDVEVSYFPTAAVSSVAVLTVVTNATDGTNKVASLTGTGTTTATATASISPTSFTFDSVEVGESDTKTFTIENTGGSGNVNVTSVTASGTPFVVTSDGCTGVSLGFGETCNFVVSFSPTAEGGFSGTVSVLTNATDGTNKIASLHAMTSAPGEINFSSETYSFTNTIETGVVYVTRTGGDSGEVSVDYTTAPGTASEIDGNYDETSGTLTWEDGDASPKKINVEIHSASFDELSRSFSILLSDPTGGAALGATSMATVELFIPGQTESSLASADTSGCAISAHRENADNSLWIMLAGLVGLLILKRRRFIS